MPRDASAAAERPRRGRRPGPSETRQAVLTAASARFAADGYTRATIRAIASDAGVDASLVMQLFGSKEDLFGAVMSITPTALARIAEAFGGPEDGLGQRVTHAFLDVWEGDPADSAPLVAILRSAIAGDQTATLLRDFIEARLITEVRTDVEPDPTGRLRVGLAASMLVGIVVGRQLVRVPTLVDADRGRLVELVGPAIHEVLVGSVRADP